MKTKNVILITGSAPYLGGPSTWAGVRAALPDDVEVTEIDPLGCISSSDPYVQMRLHIGAHIQPGCVIVAHGDAVHPAMEAAKFRDTRLVLVDPLIYGDIFTTKIGARYANYVRPALYSEAAAPLRRSYARAKMLALSNNPYFLDAAIRAHVGDTHGNLVDEAYHRFRSCKPEDLANMDALRCDAFIPMDIRDAIRKRVAFVIAANHPMRARMEYAFTLTMPGLPPGIPIVRANDAKTATHIDRPGAVVEAIGLLEDSTQARSA